MLAKLRFSHSVRVAFRFHALSQLRLTQHFIHFIQDAPESMELWTRKHRSPRPRETFG